METLVTVTLSGTGAVPAPANVTAAPSSLDFGDQGLGTTSDARQVVFTNAGTEGIAFETPYAIGTVNTLADEFRTGNSTRTGYLAPNATCTVNVIFMPYGALGTRFGRLIMQIPPQAHRSPSLN